jgi:hypothetical protein
MKPVYFPFTYITDPVAAALASCFRQTAVYQPSSLNVPESMKKWGESGMLDIRTPVNGDEDKLNTVITDYKNWANIHQGADLSFFKTRGRSIPFFEETSSQIRADIVRKTKAEIRPEPEQPDALFNARMFLCIAQEFDIQHWEIHRDLTSFETLEKDFVQSLKGDEDELSFPRASLPPEDPGNYMLAERLKAWSRLIPHDPEGSGIFITGSRSVFEEVMEIVPETEKIIAFDSIPLYETGPDENAGLWQDSLMEYLEKLLNDPSSDRGFTPLPEKKAGANISLNFCLISGKSPETLFGHWTEGELFRKNKGDSHKNTIAGLLHF